MYSKTWMNDEELISPPKHTQIYYVCNRTHPVSRWGANVLIYNAWTAAQPRSLSHSTTRAPSLLRSPACLPACRYGNAESPAGYRLADDSSCGWSHCIMRKRRLPELSWVCLHWERSRGREIDVRKSSKAAMKILSHSGYLEVQSQRELGLLF